MQEDQASNDKKAEGSGACLIDPGKKGRKIKEKKKNGLKYTNNYGINF